MFGEKITLQVLPFKMTAWMAAELALQLKSKLIARMHHVLMALCLG
jgi:hypothetical protein